MSAIPETGQAVELGSLGEHPQESLGPQSRTNPRPEFGDVERLADEVHCSEIETSDAIHGLGAGGHEYHGEITGIRIRLESGQHLEAVEILEVDVQEDHIGLEFTGGPDPGLGVVHRVEIDPLVSKTGSKKSVHEVRVVDRQNTRSSGFFDRHHISVDRHGSVDLGSDGGEAA